MAEVALADVANALQKVFAPYVTSQINRSSALIQILPVDDVEGQNIQHVVEFGAAAGTGATAEGAAASAFNSDTKVPAILPVCTYTEAFGATGLAINAALNSPNPLALKNLFQRELDNAVERLTMALSTDLYTGDGGVGGGGGVRITGFFGGAVASTGTYAGINRATYAQWAAIQRANGGVARALSFNLMRSDLSTRIAKASGKRPDLFVLGPSTHDEFGKLFQDTRRYIHEVNTMDGTIKLSGGYKILDFDGVPVIEDNTCPEGKVLALRMNKARLKQIPQRGMEITRAMGNQTLQSHTGPVRGLTARIQPLAILGDKFTFQLVVYVQLSVEQPNACGVLEDIQYTA